MGKNTDRTQRSDQLLSTTVVISQAYGGGGGTTGTYMFDYVELKNISGSPQSLNGLSLMYGSATGQFGSTATNIFALPNVTLNPGQYFLVQLSTAGTGGASLPVTPDATTTNLSMSGTNGKVALTNGLAGNTCGATATPCPLPNAQIVDLVAWGTANNAEGGASTNGGASLTSVQGNVRKTGGCTETDNNNLDFDVITAPVPRNTGSTATPCSAAPADTFGDFNGDGKSDWNVVRNTGGGPTGQITWFSQINGSATTTATPWGINGDTFIPEDYDGDGKDDIAVWRADPTLAYFYILQSSTSTFRAEQFGITGDNARVAGDYDGDGKTDVAVFRANGGATIPDPCGVGKSIWYYRPSGTPGVSFRYECWGKNGDFPAPGDYDGDGKNDYVVQQATGIGNAAVFQLKKSAGGIEQVYWGTTADLIVQGDYDGDGKTDFCTVRGSGGAIIWNILERDGGGTGASPITFGLSATDFPLAGDFDGDGKADIAVWRPSATAGNTFFYVRRSSDAGLTLFQWGQNGDYPVNAVFVN